ncbi:hypothetical protein AAG906_028068 [Vitis piasezkii]
MANSDVGAALGISHTSRRLNLTRGQNNEDWVPSINEIQAQMVESGNDDDFKRLFLIFSYATILFDHGPINEVVQNNGPQNNDNAAPDMGLIVACMEATGHQIKATQSHMNALIAAYDRDLIALKMLHPNTSNPTLEDFQPIENMGDTTEVVVERVVDEAIVRCED